MAGVHASELQMWWGVAYRTAVYHEHPGARLGGIQVQTMWHANSDARKRAALKGKRRPAIVREWEKLMAQDRRDRLADKRAKKYTKVQCGGCNGDIILEDVQLAVRDGIRMTHSCGRVLNRGGEKNG